MPKKPAPSGSSSAESASEEPMRAVKKHDKGKEQRGETGKRVPAATTGGFTPPGEMSPRSGVVKKPRPRPGEPQMAHEMKVFMDEVLRVGVEGEKIEGDELFAEACSPWLLPCSRGSVGSGCVACLPFGCCSCFPKKPCRFSFCPEPAVFDEESARALREAEKARRNDTAGSEPDDLLAIAKAELYPKLCYVPLHGTAHVFTRRWFKWLVGAIALCSIPIFIVLAAVFGLSIFMTLLIVVQFAVFIFLFPRTCVACLKLYTHLRPYHLLAGIFSILITSLIGAGLSAIPWEPLMWSYLQYVKLSDDEDGETENLISFGFQDIIPAILYTMLILLVLPVAAWFEEVIFRAGTKNWKWGLFRSFIFGIIHMTMGVPLIYNLVPLPLMGVWFTREYFEGMRRYRDAVHKVQRVQGKPAQVSDAEGEDILDDVEIPGKDTVKICSWVPWSIGPWSGNVFPEADDWGTRLHQSGLWYYKHLPTGKMYWYPPMVVRAKAAGTRSAALVHLAHNFIAIIVTAIVYLINTLAKTELKV